MSFCHWTRLCRTSFIKFQSSYLRKNKRHFKAMQNGFTRLIAVISQIRHYSILYIINGFYIFVLQSVVKLHKCSRWHSQHSAKYVLHVCNQTCYMFGCMCFVSSSIGQLIVSTNSYQCWVNTIMAGTISIGLWNFNLTLAWSSPLFAKSHTTAEPFLPPLIGSPACSARCWWQGFQRWRVKFQ